MTRFELADVANFGACRWATELGRTRLHECFAASPTRDRYESKTDEDPPKKRCTRRRVIKTAAMGTAAYLIGGPRPLTAVHESADSSNALTDWPAWRGPPW